MRLLRDGLYQVTTPYLCAGLVVRGGRVVRCAPILAARVAYWLTVAAFVGCTCVPRVDRNAWRTVPANCTVEYDARARIVASFCAVDEAVATR